MDKKPLVFRMPIGIYTYDIDYAGHVSNTAYVRWLEVLRYHFLEEYYPVKNLIEEGYFPVVVRTQILYKRPLKLFDECIGSIWVSQYKQVRHTLKAHFSVQDIIYAEAEHIMAFIDAETSTIRKIPDALMALFRKYC